MGCILTAPLIVLAQTRQKPAPTDTPINQQEKLNRGFIRINNSVSPLTSAPFLSWRYLNTDDEHTSFLILKNGVVLKNDTLRNTTCYRPTGVVKATDELQLLVLQNGIPTDTVSPAVFNNKTHHMLQLERPLKATDDSKLSSQNYSYSPNDCSVGDVDGDGQYELFVKWDPSNSQDNSKDGYTGYVYIDCYKIFPDEGEIGKKLWRINLGKNIRAGAHYTQYLVYDFDGDGKAELICKTAPGSVDGLGNYVSEAATNASIKAVSNTKDWRTSKGRVDGGYEFLTVFNGETGAAIHTIPYYPNRNAKAELSELTGSFNWDDRSGKSDKGTYGNRGERYLACVAHLGGSEEKHSAVMCRGYYTYAYIWAVDFDGEQLKTRWLHSSNKKTSYDLTNSNGTTTTYTPGASKAGEGRNTMYGNGNHNLSVADVDGDGYDEVIWGSAALDHDGKLLYSVGYGHGDAMHLGDMIPNRPGLELFQVHEDKGRYPWDLHDAATGEIIRKGGQERVDNGRGCAADIAPAYGYEFWSSYGGYENNTNYVQDSEVDGEKPARNTNPFNAVTGNVVEASKSPSQNFRIYWDGDEYDELLDGTGITKWTSTGITDLGIYTSKTSMTTLGKLGLSLSSCNSTKATPCLSADIFGDWREEVILWNSDDPSQVFIFSTTTPTNYRVPCLMLDHTYRMGIAWQQVAYNQPPHLGYYLPDYIDSFQGVADDPALAITTPSVSVAKSVVRRDYYTIGGQRIDQSTQTHGVVIERVYYSDGTQAVKKHIAK